MDFEQRSDDFAFLKANRVMLLCKTENGKAQQMQSRARQAFTIYLKCT